MDFLLARSDGVVHGHGVATTYRDLADAQRANRDRSPIVGAFGFAPDGPVALWTPGSLSTAADLSNYPAPQQLSTQVVGYRPAPEVHQQRVADVIARIGRGDADKVVLARAVDAVTDVPVDPESFVATLAAGNTERSAFAVSLDAAPGFAGRRLIGASPEVLVRVRNGEVHARPYAGSAPRYDDPAADRASRDRLAHSAKDLAEHQFVVDHLVNTLRPWCSRVDVAPEPELSSTGEMWHLATPVRAVLNQQATSLDLAVALHPTPAVCGTPTETARQIIADVEDDRRFYAGAVGWSGPDGDGEWMVAIRCIELAPDRRHLTAWAGGGIVAQSDSHSELVETDAKLRTVLTPLGALPPAT